MILDPAVAASVPMAQTLVFVVRGTPIGVYLKHFLPQNIGNPTSVYHNRGAGGG